MKTKAVILFGVLAFLLRIASYIFYNPDLTPEKQDYIFNMMALSEFVFVSMTYILIYLVRPEDKLLTIAKGVVRIILFASLFSTIKEINGLNTSNTPFETLLFCLMTLAVGFYSVQKIRKWESRTKIL